MWPYPLKVNQIVSWFRAKQDSLKSPEISVVEIKERPDGPKPAACADFDGVGAIGRIDGWVSGEFDF